MSKTFIILCSACAFILVAGMLVFMLVKVVGKHRSAKILATSSRIAALQKLNQRTTESFSTLQRGYYSCELTSKAKYERFDPKQYFFMAAAKDAQSLEELLQAVRKNEEAWARYQLQLKKLPASQYTSLALQKAENKLAAELTLKAPDMDPIVKVEWSYTSSQGTKFYSNSVYFGKSVIQEACNIASAKSAREVQISHERALMGDKLRYEVMKRDGFKCVLCGSSVKDGVKLHIDHIHPVSKGGKSTMDNLRTLCDRCNEGKGDSLEE